MPQQYDDITGFTPDSSTTNYSGFTPDSTSGFTPDDTGGGFGSGYGFPSLRDIGVTAAKIPFQLGQAALGLVDLATSPLQPIGLPPEVTKSYDFMGSMQDYLGKGADWVSSFESPELKQARQQFGQAQGLGESASAVWQNPGLAGLAIEESLPYLYAGGGIGRAAIKMVPELSPWVAGAIGEGAITAGQQAGQIREETGTLTPGQALLAGGSGIATGLLSGAGGKVANYFGLPDIDAFLADQSIKGARRIPGLIGGGLTEAFEESLQSAQEQGATNLAAGRPVEQGVIPATLMGGLAGGIMGGIGPSLRSSQSTPPPPVDMSGFTQQDLPFGPTEPTQQSLIPHPVNEFDRLADLGVRDQGQQTELDALRQQLGVNQVSTPFPPGIDPFTSRFRKIPTGPPEQQGFNFQPQADETGQVPLFGDQTLPSPQSPMIPQQEAPRPVNIPEGTSLSENQQVVTITAPNPQNVAYWRSQGYVSVAGLTDAGGKPQMVRGDIAPLYVTGDKRVPPGGPPARQQSVEPDVPGPIGAQEIGFIPGQPIEVENSLVTKTFVENRLKDGMGIKSVGPTHTTFEPISETGTGSVMSSEAPLVRGGISEMARPTREQMQATDEGYAVLPPGYEGPFDNHVVIRTLADGSRVIDPARTVGGTLYEPPITAQTPQEARNALRAERLGRINELGRPYEDLTPEVHKRYLVYDVNDNLIEKTYDLDEAHRWADENDGYVKDIGESTVKGRNFLSEATGIPPDEFIRMEIGDRVSILRNMQGSYAEHGARVANKELLQNALDETPAGGTVHVTLDHHGTTGVGGGLPSITVADNGPGLPLEVLKNEYVTLTGSGKRGKVSHTGRKTIGEMGVGKATYLLGTDSFEITTVTREPDGSTWKYEVKGNPDAMIGEDAQGNPVPPVKINKTQMPKNTPTGTEVRVFDKEQGNIDAAESYLKTFAEYSDTPVNVIMSGNRYRSQPAWNLNKTVTPRTAGVGQLVLSGTAPGGDYDLIIPTSAKWQDDANSVVVILTNRGMFQGAETVYPGGRGMIPDRVVVNIEPTVTAQNKEYPLTSPTRERMKGPFRAEIVKSIKDHIMKAAEAKREADIQAAFDSLVPGPNPNNPSKNLSFVTNDRGGRYTSQELINFNGNPRIQAIAGQMKSMLDELDALFSNPAGQHLQARTEKFGFDLADVQKGGINITPPSDDTKSLILVNLHSALHDAQGDPKLAGEILAHTILHEFTHNIARVEGAGFTWAFRGTDSAFGTARRAQVAATISKLIEGPTGGYAPDIQDLIQDHSAARGRQDTTVDFIARQAEGRVLEKPRQGGVSSSSRDTEGRTTREKVNAAKQTLISRLISEDEGTFSPTKMWSNVKKATGISQGVLPLPGQPGAKETNWVKEALAVPTNATTMLDLSAPGRQGLTMILTPEFWKAIPRMFGSLHYNTYKQIDANLRSKPLMQEKIDSMGRRIPSFGQQIGTKLFSPASEPGPRAEMTASRWLEMGIGRTTKDPTTGKKTWSPTLGSKAWQYTAGVPIRATNRAYITFLNHLNVNRTEKLLNLMRDMSVRGLNTGHAPMPGIMGGIHLKGGGNIGFTQKVSPTEALEMNPYHNIPRAREIAEFVNAATGHATPTNSLEKAVAAVGPVLFSPGLLNSRLRMMNPHTYVMASPFVRKQYLKAALSTAAAWFIMSQLIKNSVGENAEVNDDITSADAGKVRVGDARLDLGGGFLQFAVAYGRAYMGGSTSSSTGEFHRFGEGYQAQTQEDMMERFFVNKLNPMAKFAYDIANATEYNPVHMGDRTIQLFTSLFIQDLHEITKENPDLLPIFGTASLLGGGTQIYSKGESVSKFIDPENDWLVQGGGGIRSLMPWNWNEWGQQ